MYVREESDRCDFFSQDAHAFVVADEFELVGTEGEETNIFMGVQHAVVTSARAADENDRTWGGWPAQSEVAHRIAADAAVLKKSEEVKRDPAYDLASKKDIEARADDFARCSIGDDGPNNSRDSWDQPEEDRDEVAQPLAA